MEEIAKQLLNYGGLGLGLMFAGLIYVRMERRGDAKDAARESAAAKYASEFEAERQRHQEEIQALRERADAAAAKHQEELDAFRDRYVAKAENFAIHGAELAAKVSEALLRMNAALDALVKAAERANERRRPTT